MSIVLFVVSDLLLKGGGGHGLSFVYWPWYELAFLLEGPLLLWTEHYCCGLGIMCSVGGEGISEPLTGAAR